MKRIMVILIAGLLGFTALYAEENGDASYSTTNVSNGGSITGTITYAGTLTSLKPIQVSKDRDVCGKHKPAENLVVNPDNKGLLNAVVFLNGLESGKSWKLDNDLAIDQKGCVFTPHVLVVPASKEFYILNNDGILHNFHTRSEKNTSINKAQPKFLKKIKVKFDEPEFIRVSCDVHNWMQSWIVVAANPYYVVTDLDGNFELKDITPGNYELIIWHEKLGETSLQVEVSSGKAANVNHAF